MRSLKSRGVGRAQGLTLLELVIVLAILSMFAGLVVYHLSPAELTFSGAGGNKTAPRLATESTMYSVQQAMFGSAEKQGYWDDMNHDIWFWPRYLEWLSRAPTDAAIVDPYSDPLAATYYNSIMAYDVKKKVGWRGPYVQFQGIPIPLNPSKGFTARLGGGAYRGPLDGWGRPIMVQLPSTYLGTGIDPISARGNGAQEQYLYTNARLVSAGPNGILETELNINSLQTYADFQLNPALAADDVVTWLRR